MAEYTISIENKAGDERSYCVVAEPPDVNNKTTNPGDYLMTPVLYKPEAPLSLNAKESITFTYNYSAFVGKLLAKGGFKRIDYTNAIPITLGTLHDNGPTVEVSYNERGVVSIKEIVSEPCGAGTFMIKCGKKPSSVKAVHVVGLAQHVSEADEPIATAVMPYIEKKEYTVKPSGRMCICLASESMEVGFVIGPNQTKFAAIEFLKGNRTVTVTEDENQNFWLKKPLKQLQQATLFDIFHDKSQTAPIPQSTHHNNPPNPPIPPKPVVEPPWMRRANELGLTGLRELSAFEFLTKYNQTQLANFYNAEYLKEIASKAGEWGDQIAKNGNLVDEFIDDVLVLALFDCILFLDNSTSIQWGNRSAELQAICANIVEIEAIYKNTDTVRVEFLNGARRNDVVSTEDAVRKLVADIENYGQTPLGEQLEAKILNHYVYPKLDKKEKFRPVLICVITDGVPCPEDKYVFQNKIQDCKKKLNARDMSMVGDKHVLFQISRVGNDGGAEKFIKSLEGLNDILHCTSYQDITMSYDEKDPISIYAPAIRRLAGAAFVGLKRGKNLKFIFPGEGKA